MPTNDESGLIPETGAARPTVPPLCLVTGPALITHLAIRPLRVRQSRIGSPWLESMVVNKLDDAKQRSPHKMAGRAHVEALAFVQYLAD